MDNQILLQGDSLEVLKDFPDNSVDAVVTDPPYGLSFMGKKWDYDVPSCDLWREVLRVLKPGGHLLSFGGTRTYHRMVIAIETAGFDIRDQVQWLYGSGFPKSMNIALAMDKSAGAKPTTIGVNPTSDLAKKWQGWGTALKPANEPICLARKPLEKGLTVAQNIEKYGCGALNIDASRIGYTSEADKASATPQGKVTSKRPEDGYAKAAGVKSERYEIERPELKGRWPANIILDEQAAKVLGEPSRFFYVAKASKNERNAGLEGMPLVEKKTLNDYVHNSEGRTASKSGAPSQNRHPTVKPIKLMEYLCRMITPPDGVILDPFMGSGTTGIAAKNLGFGFIGIDLSPEYLEIAQKRIGNA